MLKIGDILKDKYRITKEIGFGGTAQVFLADDLTIIGRHWAVKEISKAGRIFEAIKKEDGDFREVNFLSEIESPFSPRIVDKVENEESLIVIMDYIEGETLQDKLNREGAQPENLVIDWIISVCRLFEHIHTLPKPILYLDLKPLNIMLKPDGMISVVDFGGAIYKGEKREKALVGSYGYFSPEHKTGNYDERADIYTIGMTMYQLLENDKTISQRDFMRHKLKSEKLEEILSKCIAPKELRYQSVEELRKDLDAYKLVVIYSGDKDAALHTSILTQQLEVWKETGEYSYLQEIEELKQENARKDKKLKNASAAKHLVNGIGGIFTFIIRAIIAAGFAVGLITLAYPTTRQAFFALLNLAFKSVGIDVPWLN